MHDADNVNLTDNRSLFYLLPLPDWKQAGIFFSSPY